MSDDAPARKKRRPRAELKELMIQAGVEVLAEHGVEMQISSVSYAKVFEHLERTKGVRVTYGSVHERIWDSLQEYQLSVIERAGLWDSASTQTDASQYTRLLADAASDVGEGEDRLARYRDTFRQFALTYFNDENAADWSAWLKTVATMSTQPEGSPPREAAIAGARATYATQHEAVDAFLLGSLTEAGFETAGLADDDVLEILARVSCAVADGLDLRRTLTEEPQPTTISVATGPDGGLQEWNLYGLVMWALISQLFDHPNS